MIDTICIPLAAGLLAVMGAWALLQALGKWAARD